MKIFALLLACYVMTYTHLNNVSKKQDDLFLVKVSEQGFKDSKKYMKFTHNGNLLVLRDGDTQQLSLHSIYTSSKAVYKSSGKKYLGVVLVDSKKKKKTTTTL